MRQLKGTKSSLCLVIKEVQLKAEFVIKPAGACYSRLKLWLL